jgi:predicted regulator of Ras-like GTPase activity (Roadblock/LC7/MglB family)
MPYSKILDKLVEDVQGSVGAGFVDYDGEVVQLSGRLEDYAHKVHLACQGILLARTQKAHPSDPLQWVTVIHENYTSVIKPLNSDYCLILTLDKHNNLFKAIHLIEAAAKAINADL